jgi:hypothetical protein
VSDLHVRDKYFQHFSLHAYVGEVPENGCPSREANEHVRARPSRPSTSERLRNPDALLSRTDLRELGLERRAVDAVFRALDVIVLPGYSRPLVRVGDYLDLLKRCTYDGTRVR